MIYELIKPGHVLQTITEISEEDFKDLSTLMDHLITSFFEANHVLILYENCGAATYSDLEVSDEIQNTFREDIRKQILKKEPDCNPVILQVLVELNLPVFIKRYKWSQGQIPGRFQRNLPSFYAKSFVFALDNFQTSLKVISQIPNLPYQSKIKDILDKFNQYFVHLRHVRNSAHHMEDRLRGLGSYNRQTKQKEKIQGQAISELGVSLGEGCLVVNSLFFNHYSFTNEDGSLGKVEISHSSMQVFHNCLQDLITTFEWQNYGIGEKVFLPEE